MLASRPSRIVALVVGLLLTFATGSAATSGPSFTDRSISAHGLFSADGSFFLDPPDRRRILFLGDSITRAGGYVDVVDAYLLSRFPRRDYQLINLGLSSETVSGLTEPDHPFPRPNLLDRLGRALRLVAPDVVVACYGMNDGIYRPFSKRRFEAFRSGINQLIKKVKAAGAELVLMTPPPFDPAAVEEKLASEDAQGNGYKAPYRNYDEVLGRYATWIRQQAGRVAQVVDLHGAISERLTARRQQDPDYTLTRDGVHPVAFGHWLIARELLRAWDAPGLGPLPGTERELKKLKKKDAPARFMKLVRRRQDLLSNAWLARVGHQRPGDYEALPLEEAKRQAAQLEKQIRVKRDAARQAGL